MISDTCLQEGVVLESFSLFGHLKQYNFNIIYDNMLPDHVR